MYFTVIQQKAYMKVWDLNYGEMNPRQSAGTENILMNIIFR